jgi:hypothetical protein
LAKNGVHIFVADKNETVKQGGARIHVFVADWAEEKATIGYLNEGARFCST